MWMTRVSIRNPVFATMIMVAIAVLGLFSYQRLKVEQMPEVALPFVLVLTNYPGAAPEAVETDVTKPLEYALNQISGVKLIRSNSHEGISTVFAEFRLDTDVTRAMQDVRDKIAVVRPSFPRDVKDPLVIRADNENEQPVVSIAVLSTSVGLRELTSLTDQTIVKAFESLPGVAKIDVNGRVTRQVLIRIKPDALTALGIGVDQVMTAVRAANQDMPAGRITRGNSDAVVRVEGKLREPAQFGRIIVAQQGGGPVYMSQVADVIDGEKEETSLARINGRPAITIDIRKAQDANIVDTGRYVREAVASLKDRLPPDVEVQIVYSSADAVEKSVNRVKHTIVEGALLTVLIVFLFLHSWRSTVITGLTLPISVVATFIALYAFGFTLNFLTLMALSLCIGLLIDDAIVVRENIVRHLAMGKTHRQAAQEATDEIGLAVMATTFAIVAVFVPIAFMQGIIGRFFYQFGVTVTVAVLVSLFVSFTLDPMLSSVWRDPAEGRFQRVRWLGRMMEGIEHGIEWLHRVYGVILDWALAHRKSVIAIALAMFLASFGVPPLVGTEFVPEGDQGFISLRLNTPVGSSLEYTDSKVRQVEEALKAFPEIRLAITTVGTEEGRNYSRVNMKLTEKEDRARSQKTLEGEIRNALLPIAGVELALGFNRPIWVNLLGPDPETLSTIMRDFQARVAKVPGITDLENSDKAANPALSIRLNNATAADLGITVQQVGSTLRPLLAGRHGELLAGAGREQLRGERSAAEGPAAPGLGSRQPLDIDEQARTGRRAADGAAAADRRDRRDHEPADHQASGAAASRRALRERRGAAVRRRRQRRAEDHRPDETRASTGVPIRRRRPAEGHAGILPGRARGARPRGHLHLPDPRVAVRQLRAADRDHGEPAVLADRRVPRAAADRHDAQHLLDHRRDHADGAGHEERDPARRFRKPRAARGRVGQRGAGRSRAGAVAPDHDDDCRDDRRHAAAGHRRR